LLHAKEKEKISGINCHWESAADESRQNELAHANFLAIIEHNYEVAHFTYHVSILEPIDATDLLFTYQREDLRHHLSLAINCR
jgi:hypothetical protein